MIHLVSQDLHTQTMLTYYSYALIFPFYLFLLITFFIYPSVLSLRPVNTISSVVGHDDDVVAVQHLAGGLLLGLGCDVADA